MKKKVFGALAAALLMTAFLATSCKKDDVDNTKPTIVINEPEEEEQFALGSELHLDVDFADDVELHQYKVDIHSAEGHDHKSTSEKWVFEQVYDLSGYKNKNIHDLIAIPATIDAGDYHVIIYCTDKAGNESSAFKIFEVKASGK